MWASALTGEKGGGVIAHWKLAFATWGVRASVKTDTGLAYISQKMRTNNYFTVLPNSNNSVILNYFLSLQSAGEMHLPRAEVWVHLLTENWEGLYELLLRGVGMLVFPQIPGYDGYLRDAFALACTTRSRTGNHRSSFKCDQNAEHPSNDPSDDNQDVKHQPGPSTSRD